MTLSEGECGDTSDDARTTSWLLRRGFSIAAVEYIHVSKMPSALKMPVSGISTPRSPSIRLKSQQVARCRPTSLPRCCCIRADAVARELLTEDTVEAFSRLFRTAETDTWGCLRLTQRLSTQRCAPVELPHRVELVARLALCWRSDASLLHGLRRLLLLFVVLLLPPLAVHHSR
jgi:hypothetical protein